ncbi:MAG: MBL fold metallo-hydrolase [Methanomicrobiales archaeon]|nr:MBL fold metallo-hydrolase [Methanomicrobiales archaeon]
MVVKFIPGRGMYANAYVARGTLLIDAGVTPMEIEAHRNTITHIVLTHCHYDHIAYLQALQKITGAKICIHEADAKGLTNDNLSLSMHFGAHSPGIIPDIILKEGEFIEGYEIIHTPGHTPGSICLYDADSGDLISGDTVFSDGAFGRYDFPGGSKITLTKSLEKLAALKVTALYPGHGIPAREMGDRHIRAALTLIQSGYG